MTPAEEFFYAHAGYSVGPGETTEQGHLRSARELAQAEAEGKQLGLTFEWVPDEPEEHEGTMHPTYGCVVYDVSGDTGVSLWAIMFADDGGPGRDPYTRVVEAELADEYLNRATEVARCPEWRALAAYASA